MNKPTTKGAASAALLAHLERTEERLGALEDLYAVLRKRVTDLERVNTAELDDLHARGEDS